MAAGRKRKRASLKDLPVAPPPPEDEDQDDDDKETDE